MYSESWNNQETFLMHILLVDDDPVDLAFLKECVENIHGSDYQVSVARDQEEAIAAYAKHPIACALVDYYMKDTSGADLVDLLHALPRYISEEGEALAFDKYAQLPIAVISGAKSEEMKQRVAKTGAQCVIAKDEITSSEKLEALFIQLLKR